MGDKNTTITAKIMQDKKHINNHCNPNDGEEHDFFNSSSRSKDLYMYSHEGQPLIRKLAPLPRQSQDNFLFKRTPTESTAECSLRMVIAGFLFLILFCVLSPSPSNNSYSDNGGLRPFQKSWQGVFSTTSPQNTKDIVAAEPSSTSSSAFQHRQSGCRQIVPAKVAVRTDLDGFASYWNYADDRQSPINVTYDKRSLLINGQRSLFLSGSMHPVRATRNSWNLACDEAVRNGLNMITIYVFWSAHQPLPDQPLDWSLPGNTLECQQIMEQKSNEIYHIGGDVDQSREATTVQQNQVDMNASSTTATKFASDGDQDDDDDDDDSCSCRWDLATAIRAAASRGLWIHIRLGPYDCAEYNYGGIPAWLPLQNPNMRMRRYDPDWLHAMDEFITSSTQYLREEKLWAYQGGPIVMAQIENELGGDDDEDLEIAKDQKGQDKKNHTQMQDYADWCGELATRLEPNVVWTMCNGLSASQTISTCNGVMGSQSCSTTWLEQFGDSGRIQQDQPAIWTEAEQGFQVWGENPQHPSDYFWGTTTTDMAHDALRWFARGGASLNWYMWWGGYNRGRAAAAGIMNMYASDAPLCPSGQRRQPKFGHLQALHESIADVADMLVNSPTALFSSRPIEYMNPQGRWEVGQNQRVFVYRLRQEQQQQTDDQAGDDAIWREASFVENDSTFSTVVRFPVQSLGIVKVLAMAPQSSALVVDGMLRFDSSAVNPRSMSYNRVVEKNSVMMLDWQQWMEPRTASSSWNNNNNSRYRMVRSVQPVEQTNLTVSARLDSDYVWYETNLTLKSDLYNATLSIETQKANAFSVFLNGELVGTPGNHQHAEGNLTLTVELGDVVAGVHTLAILSESLGYFNLIGRWGASTGAKTKGITGDVFLFRDNNETWWRQSLVDGRNWLSFAGLHGENSIDQRSVNRTVLDINLEKGGSVGAPCTWTSALFDTPNYDPTSQALFVGITVGRGHLWLNGHDLGRFWNVTRDDDEKATAAARNSQYSQQYYLLPFDFLYTDGKLNELIFFNAMDGDLRSGATLVMSWTQESDKPNFMDQVDFPLACV